MIQGGWEYVIGAYTVTWVVWGGYALSLWVRHRRTAKDEAVIARSETTKQSS